MTDPPIACTLTPDELRAGAKELLPGLAPLAVEQRQLADGIALRFEPAGDLLSRLTSVIDRERRCCAFLHFRLTIDAGDGPVWLEVTGPPGTREVLRELMTEATSKPFSGAGGAA